MKLGPLPVSIIAKQFIAKTVHQELMQKYKGQDNIIVKLTDTNTFTHNNPEVPTLGKGKSVDLLN